MTVNNTGWDTHAGLVLRLKEGYAGAAVGVGLVPLFDHAFAALIHENNRAGIMVTHDLRMCKYVDRVLQMQDGKLVREYTSRAEIDALAKGDH